MLSDGVKLDGHEVTPEDAQGTDLKRFQLMMVTKISTDMAKDFAILPKVEWSIYDDWIENMMTLRVRQEILGQGPFACPTIEFPRNWIEAVKERFAPAWFKNRWPVKYTKNYFDVRIIYPMMKYPDDDVRVTAEVKEVKDE